MTARRAAGIGAIVLGGGLLAWALLALTIGGGPRADGAAGASGPAALVATLEGPAPPSKPAVETAPTETAPANAKPNAEAPAPTGASANAEAPAPEPEVAPARAIVREVETRRIYQVGIGPWTWRFSAPESFDVLDAIDRVRGFLGIFAILGAAVFLSERPRAISGRTVFWGLALQWAFALLVLRVEAGEWLLIEAEALVRSVLDSAMAGTRFVFGDALANDQGPVAFVFAFQVLPAVIFVSSLFAVLYHIGVMRWVVRGFAWIMTRLMRVSGAESLDVAASLFLGQTEAPLVIRPYLARLTRSELLTVMTAGMAHVSGGVMLAYVKFGVDVRHILTAVIMTAPGAILISKILVPETERPETLNGASDLARSTDANVLGATARGAREGLELALNIAAMLIAFLGLIALADKGLAFFGTSLEAILGWAMAPVAFLMGVPFEDVKPVGQLLGARTVFNELIAYSQLHEMKAQQILMDRSVTIANFALCGFANIGSVGIQLGGIGALAPERRRDLAQLGLKALFAGTLANYLSACIAGVLL